MRLFYTNTKWFVLYGRTLHIFPLTHTSYIPTMDAVVYYQIDFYATQYNRNVCLS